MMQMWSGQRSPGSDGSSPRRVTFAVQSASPVVYSRREADPYAADQSEELRRQRLQQRRDEKKPQRNARKAREAVSGKTRARRPGWDAHVSHGSTLFDASLKKSLLFQPRAGDRRKEESERDGVSVAVGKTAKPVKNKAAARTPVRYRSGPSSVYAQQRHNVTHWPQRRAKDFVRQNIEHLTGRPADVRTARSATRSGSRESVFERLSAPRVSKALLRSHTLPFQTDSKPSPVPARSPSASSLSPPRSRAASSPVLTIDPPAPDKQESLRSATPSPGVRKPDLGWISPHSSPQRSQQSVSSRHSPAPRSNSTNRSSYGDPRGRRYDNYPARVFGVLDRDNERRIGVGQILEGLRLLGLPATHNQISDYVYLVHEGRHDTIDLEEWEILVGTLDAASRPSSHSPRSQSAVMPSQSPTLRSISERSPHSSMPPSISPQTRGDRRSSPMDKRQSLSSFTPLMYSRNARPKQDEDDDQRYSTSVQREAIVSAEHQPIPEDDPYLEEIQNRIEGMFERAQATASLRWAPEQKNNQFENDPDHSRSDRILKRAASVVYSLRASLFPLVHQAEATLREIQQRHGSKLSLFLPREDMATIAKNSDVLASAILDDMLLDTIQLLNEEDKQQSCRQLEAHHASQLDEILARIQEIERAEDTMIQQGLALSYKTPGPECKLPTASSYDGPYSKQTNPAYHDSMNLTLPLEVVMNIDIPDNEFGPLSQGNAETSVKSIVIERDEVDFEGLKIKSQQALYANLSVQTSIVQGKRLQSIERRRHKFQHHRQLVESSLADSGMAQFAVIEMLEELLLDDLLEETAAELNGTVVSMSDTLFTSLL